MAIAVHGDIGHPAALTKSVELGISVKAVHKEAKVMKHEAVQSVRNVLVGVVLFGLVSAAYGATLHVANNGVDGAGCGPAASPCRSITQGIGNAVAGDTILVGPGLYGDLNHNGTLGETGEETPSPGCGCMLSVNKPVILLSSDGAAATVIDAITVNIIQNVLIIASGEFGRPDHGFLVTNPGNTSSAGIVIDATNVKIRGNQVQSLGSGGAGIETVNNPGETVLIEMNQVIGWGTGINARSAGKTVSKNQVSLNGTGIDADGGSVTGNVATDNFFGGFRLSGAASAIGNAAYGNRVGFGVNPPFTGVFTGVVQKNNTFSNLECGVRNGGVTGLVATNNYWGAATGPGADPADDVCNPAGTTVVTPFAMKPFAINPPFEP